MIEVQMKKVGWDAGSSLKEIHILEGFQQAGHGKIISACVLQSKEIGDGRCEN